MRMKKMRRIDAHQRACQFTNIRIVQTRAKMGGIGKANPHQKTPPTGSSTSARTAPDL